MIARRSAELLLSMVFAPMVLNAFYFWIADNLIQTDTAPRSSSGSTEPDSPESPPMLGKFVKCW